MNEHQARREAMAREQRKFLNALSAGQAGAIDRLSRTIKPGQKLLFHPPYDLIFDVQAVNPVLDPSAPPGLMVLTLSVVMPVQLQANSPNPTMVIVAEAGAMAQATDPPSDPPPQDPPPADPPPDDAAPSQIQLVDR